MDLDEELSMLAELDELELIPDDSEIGVHDVPSTSHDVRKEPNSESTHASVPGTSKRKKPRRVHVKPAVSLDDLLPEAVNMLRSSICSPNSPVMSTPIGEKMTAVGHCLQNYPDDDFSKLSEFLLKEIWKVVESGKNLPVGAQANTEMWKHFHELRLNDSVADEWRCFFVEHVSFNVDELVVNMILQETLTEFLQKVLQKRNVLPPDEVSSQQKDFTTHDQEVLQYIAGFIPFALCKKYKRMSSEVAKQYVVFLANLKVKEDDTDVDSFLDYTKEWTRLQNRGGLFLVNDRCYRLFQAMEVQTRKHLSDEFLVEGRSKPIKDILYSKLISNVYVLKMWEAVHGDELVNGDGLLRTFVNYWIEIRLRAVVKLFMQKKKDKRNKKGEKGLRKELNKK